MVLRFKNRVVCSRPHGFSEPRRHQFNCHRKSLIYIIAFQLFFATLPSTRPPSGSAIRLCSARQRKRFLMNRRERVHLCKLSNLRFSLAYVVTSTHVPNRPQVVRKEQRHDSAAPSGHRPLRTPPRECNKCSALSRVYPLTEQWFVPPWRGSSSLGRIILPRIICFTPHGPK